MKFCSRQNFTNLNFSIKWDQTWLDLGWVLFCFFCFFHIFFLCTSCYACRYFYLITKLSLNNTKHCVSPCTAKDWCWFPCLLSGMWRSSPPLVSASSSSTWALELIKFVITWRCVCLLLQIPELDEPFHWGSLKCHIMSGAVVSVFSLPLSTFGSSGFSTLLLFVPVGIFPRVSLFVNTWGGKLARSRLVKCLQTMMCEEMHCCPRVHQNTISTCRSACDTFDKYKPLSHCVFFFFRAFEQWDLLHPFSLPTCFYAFRYTF